MIVTIEEQFHTSGVLPLVRRKAIDRGALGVGINCCRRTLVVKNTDAPYKITGNRPMVIEPGLSVYQLF
jgi:hypothetical protein